MASLGQKHGSCRHLMTMLKLHVKCTRCHDRVIGTDPYVLKKYF